MEWSKEVMARNIQWYMNKANVNQKELSQIVGVSAPTVNDWIKAKKYPRIDKIEKMANYFGCEKSDLIENKKKPDTMTEVELSKNKRELMQLVQECPEDQAARLLQILQLFLQNAPRDN